MIKTVKNLPKIGYNFIRYWSWSGYSYCFDHFSSFV